MWRLAAPLLALAVLGALEWVRTLAVLAGARLAAGVPATRMIVILAAVALVTALAALVFRHPRLVRFYARDPRPEAP